MRKLITLLLLLSLSACKSDTTDSFNEQINDSLSDIKNLDTKKLSKHAKDLGSLTTEQLQALTQIEYKVFEIDTSEGINYLQSNLTALGKERWDCHVNENNASTKLRIVCKRYPLNYFGMLKGVLGF